MGADKRPVRSSKVRAMARVSMQQQSDEEELEHQLELGNREPSRRRSSRSHARVVTIDSDIDAHSPHRLHHHDDDDDDPDDDHHDPKSFVQYTAPRPAHHSNSDESHQDDDDDDDDDDALDMDVEYLDAPSTSVAVVTKSGRQVKPRQLETPMSPIRARRNPAPANPTRLGRLTRRRSKAAPDFPYSPGVSSVRVRTRIRQARPSYSLNEDENDDFDDEDVFMDGSSSVPPRIQDKTTRVLRTRSKDETSNGHRRSTRNKTSSQLESPQLSVDAKDTSLGNGIAKATRASTRQATYGTTRKEAGREEDGDGDFPSPGTGEESEDQDMPDTGIPDNALADDSDFVEVPRRPRRASSRRNRKTQPRRSVRSKRQRTKERPPRQENPIAREVRKSYRPRNDSLRASDYYAEAESSSEESSSGGEFMLSRSRPKRAAASRAGDAIAKKMDNLKSPMLAEGSMAKRPRGRYERRKSRFRPAGKDPFPSDDDALGPAGVAGIEPIQVDLDLSWNDVGGLDHHVRGLKEMVALPLLYPEIFEKFNMEPPKGVLFYGPPGTGKTLCARALAASCGPEPESSIPKNDDPTSSKQEDASRDANMVQSLPANTTKVASPKVPNANGDLGETKRGDPHPDVVMSEAQVDGSQVVVPNGPLAGANESTTQAAENLVPDCGAGIAAEHKAVVVERGSELQGKIAQRVPIGDGAEAEKGEPNISPTNAENSKTRPKKKPRVAFFMRNGADCLSKWVGEAERQLRMTFEAAKKHQPSIIFFDEIDGLAPVRSSRQDQIHSSIVSTLLGLMDGLDARGKVVVIGATNRVDAIDPALRRPGRFDRELIFTLPNARARRKILGIHTLKWVPPPSSEVLDTVASMTVGYCGADLKALCTEAAIRALRRRYPQIYSSKEKLLINTDEVNVKTRDFMAAMKEIVPASHRSARTNARPIASRLGEILNTPLESCIAILKCVFPQGLEYSESAPNLEAGRSGETDKPDNASPKNLDADSMSSSSDDEYDDAEIGKAQDGIANAGKMRPVGGNGKHMNLQVLRPRLLICGMKGLGQTQIGPAILYRFEGCPVHAIDYPSLHSDAGARCAEEALVTAFREAMRSVPSILYLPHLDLWWESASPSLRTTLVIALRDLPSDLPLLVLATADAPLNELAPEVTELFVETVELSAPSEASRKRMFSPLLDEAQAIPRFSRATAKRLRKKRRTEVLPIAPPQRPKIPTEVEVNRKRLEEDKYIRIMRMEMRNFLDTLIRDNRFKAFWYPVDPDSAPDYYDIIKVPMDIAKIASQNDLGRYPTVLAMVNDFDILVRNAIQYNPPNTEMGAAILRRAHGLIDIVHAWVDNLPPALVETCNKIIAERVSRKQREITAAQAALTAETAAETAAEKKSSDDASHAPKEIDADDKAEPDTGKLEPKELNIEVKQCISDSQMNGNVIADVIESEGAKTSEGSQKTRAEDEEGEVAVDEVVVASRSEVMALGKLLLDVSSGVTVDGLESLFVRCSKVLRENRRNMNRDEVVKHLMRTATEARDDPAVVGTLVE